MCGSGAGIKNLKPKLKKDWEGLTVVTLVPLKTNGGSEFPAGTKMKVTRNFVGLHLEAVEACKRCKLRRWHTIKGVSEQHVLIVES